MEIDIDMLKTELYSIFSATKQTLFAQNSLFNAITSVAAFISRAEGAKNLAISIDFDQKISTLYVKICEI